MKFNAIKQGARVKFVLQRPYTKEELKLGYDNNVNGKVGTIVFHHIQTLTSIVEVLLDEPFINKYGKKDELYVVDNIENLELL